MVIWSEHIVNAIWIRYRNIFADNNNNDNKERIEREENVDDDNDDVDDGEKDDRRRRLTWDRCAWKHHELKTSLYICEIICVN